MDHERIKEAIEAMELLDIYLNSSSLERDRNFDHHFPSERLCQQSKLTVSADLLKNQENDNNPERHFLRALITFGLRFVETANVDDSGSEETRELAEITACFTAMYQVDRELPDDVVQEFITHNAVHNVWPFWREHAIRVAAEAKLPRPQIGLFKPSPSR